MIPREAALISLVKPFITPAIDTTPKPFTTPAIPYRPKRFGTPAELQTPQDFVTPAQEYRPRRFGTPAVPYAPKPLETYIGEQAKGWREYPGVETPEGGYVPEGAFTRLADKKVRKEISDEGSVIDPDWEKILYDPSRGKLPGIFDRLLRENPGKSLNDLKKEGNRDALYYLNAQDNNKAKIKDVFGHNEIFNQYPDLQDLEVNPFASGKGDFSEGRIRLNPSSFVGKDDAKSTLLHELQHAIQEKEGFARGGSPDTEKSSPHLEDYKNTIRGLDNLQVAMIEGRDSAEVYSPISGQWKTISKDSFQNVLDKYIKEADSMKKFINENGYDLNPYDRYQRLAGEVESRDVQARMNMPMSQRVKSQPYQSQGIPVNRQIVRYGGGKAENTIRPRKVSRVKISSK